MEVLRAPSHRFENLPDYPFQENFIEINELRVHYLDEGSGEIILCLHGEPTWSFLYRKFYPVLTPQYRVIAPDFIGFGKSDKPTRISDYNYSMHFDILTGFIQNLNISDITLVVHDWGGLLGLGVLGAYPEKFKRVVILNTGLPVGDRPLPLVFKLWRMFAKYHPTLPVGSIVSAGCYKKTSKTREIISAYKAPFPSRKYKAGTKAFPLMVPGKSTDLGVEEMLKAREVLAKWEKPALVMFSDKDPIMRGIDKFFRKLIPSAKEQENITIKNAGHFLQEDSGEEIARYILQFIKGELTVNS